MNKSLVTHSGEFLSSCCVKYSSEVFAVVFVVVSVAVVFVLSEMLSDLLQAVKPSMVITTQSVDAITLKDIFLS